MKNIYSKLVLVSLLLVTFSSTVSARECIECKKANTKSAAVKAKAAACKRAQSTAELNINNVRALINGYGNMWYDGSVAQYHLPKNSNTCPLFCAALWIGGTDVNDQLRIAALRFGSDGDDYWPGPLKIDGTASTDLPVCNYYDKHYIITKAEVLSFMDHFDYTGASPVQKSDPGEDLTEVILNWPASGAGGEDLSPYLAPFYDADNDGVYNPHNGDYPWYDFNNELCPRTIKQQHPERANVALPTMETEKNYVKGGILSDQVLKGDQTIWWVFNDMGNTHTETKGQPIGLEIRAQAFAFSTNDRINDMTFYSYEIINRSTYELRETEELSEQKLYLGWIVGDTIGGEIYPSMLEVPNLADKKYVLIGDYEDDRHNTYIGEMSGALINFNAYLTLLYGHHRISLWMFVFLWGAFFILIWLTIRHTTFSRIFMWLGSPFYLTLTCLVCYRFFHEVYDILIATSLFYLLETTMECINNRQVIYKKINIIWQQIKLWERRFILK